MNGPSSYELNFGTVLIVDDVLTQDVNLTSPYVGRTKGIYEFANVKGGSIHMDFIIYFENKIYNGSNLKILGMDAFSKGTPSEMAVVGGTRKFRYTHGYAKIETIASKGINAIVNFNATYHLH